MNEGIYIAASGGIKQQAQLDVVSNNLANLNSPGFKKDGLIFEAIVPPTNSQVSHDKANASASLARELISNVAYVGIVKTQTDFSQGALFETQNMLDVALDGDAFLVVETEEGTRYTRGGNLKLDGLGQLVTRDNYRVLSVLGDPIVIEAAQGANISIDSDGSIIVGNGLENSTIGKLKIVTFENKTALVKEGAGYFKNTDPAENEIIPKGVSVHQGFLESSNVQAVGEMIKMIETVRVFEAYQKIIQAIDEADTQSVNNIARVA